ELAGIHGSHATTRNVIPRKRWFRVSPADRRGTAAGMGTCEVCGNEYDMAFEVVAASVSHTFDSFECAIHKLAPVCDHCSCKVIVHGIEANGTFYCCTHCAHEEGAMQVVDNASHTAR